MTTKWAKHTPGPWRWFNRYLMQDCPAKDGEGKETNPYATPCEHPIADDGSAGGEYSEMIDVNGPDARLIAAAPTLLEALTMLHRIALQTPAMNNPDDWEVIEQAWRAINLAVGAEEENTQ